MTVKVKQEGFILGYVFGKIEKHIIEAFMKQKNEIDCHVSVPKVWFGLKPVRDVSECLSLPVKDEYKQKVTEILEGYNTSSRNYKYEITIRPQMQFMEFSIHGYYVEPVKEMTLEQIEKELGYKIKVVSEK